MTPADLFVAMRGNIMPKYGAPIPVKIGLFWSTAHPASVVITATHKDDTIETWEVSRDLFVAAGRVPGGWYGGGDFAVCHPPNALRYTWLSFKRGQDRALVTVPRPEVEEFIAHTCRIITPGSDLETELLTAQIDRDLQRLFP